MLEKRYIYIYIYIYMIILYINLSYIDFHSRFCHQHSSGICYYLGSLLGDLFSKCVITLHKLESILCSDKKLLVASHHFAATARSIHVRHHRLWKNRPRHSAEYFTKDRSDITKHTRQQNKNTVRSVVH